MWPFGVSGAKPRSSNHLMRHRFCRVAALFSKDHLMAKRGRPSAYKSDYVEQARKLCELGAIDVDLADFFEVTIGTIWQWQRRHPEFLSAIKVGKENADDRVERSLYHKANGYTFESEKVFQFQGKIVRAQTREHIPPDTTAAVFWLKNRRKNDWRDRQEYTGADGSPLIPEYTDEQRAKALAVLLAKAKANE